LSLALSRAQESFSSSALCALNNTIVGLYDGGLFVLGDGNPGFVESCKPSRIKIIYLQKIPHIISMTIGETLSDSRASVFQIIRETHSEEYLGYWSVGMWVHQSVKAGLMN
jgi:hypothetical protein